MASSKAKTKIANTEDNIIDIDLSITRKKKFRIDKDNDRILELNTSDVTIVSRMEESYSRLQNLAKNAAEILSKVEDEDDEETTLGKGIREVDKEMRELIDFIFDSNVSEICAPSGSMYDPFEGTYRYEHIISTLLNLYSDNIKSETDKIKKNVSKHTEKYIKK